MIKNQQTFFLYCATFLYSAADALVSLPYHQPPVPTPSPLHPPPATTVCVVPRGTCSALLLGKGCRTSLFGFCKKKYSILKKNSTGLWF